MLLNEKRKKTISKRLQKAVEYGLENYPISARQASMAVVGHDGLIRDIKAGIIPSADRLEALFDFLDLEFYFGPKRYAEPELVTTIGSDDFTPVRVYTAEASAGPGLLNPEEDRIGTLAFKRTWLQQIGLNPAKSSILRVKGDSMEPTIKDGSIILVDEQKKQPVGNSIFAFIEDDELRIKRLDVIDGGKSKVLTITSDNPDYPSEVRINSDINKLRVLGQVVWTGYNLKESDK
jgi:hypothetical protein